jgi:hypothetical protein
MISNQLTQPPAIGEEFSQEIVFTLEVRRFPENPPPLTIMRSLSRVFRANCCVGEAFRTRIHSASQE